MAFEVNFSNRQRRATIDTGWLQDTLVLLSQAICDNLLERPPEHLSKREIKQISERGQMSVILVSNRRIRLLNRRWRAKDKPTDVLSFPLTLSAPAAELPWEVGEVIISAEKAVEQASDLGHSLERELSFLFVHGCLHVLGFDHEKPDEEKEMFARQNDILRAAGITR